jgi:uncharacterized protein DUF6869
MSIPEHVIKPELLEAYLRRLNQLAAVRVSELNLQNARDALQELSVDKDYYAAWERIEELVASEPAVAWPLLLQIVQLAPENSLHIVGAGPLEDFLVAHSEQYLAEISQQLQHDLHFRRAFQMAYLYDLPERVWRHFNSVLAELGVPSDQLRDWST